MRVVYASQLSPNDSSQYRLGALERSGVEVIPLNSYDYGLSNPLLRKLEFRLAMGPEVNRMNRDLLSLVNEHSADVVWADKLLWMKPRTLTQLRERGVATVSYMIDNFFGPRRDPGWRLYSDCISLYDLHVTQRDSNLKSYREHGARDVLKVQTAFEPTLHFASKVPYEDSQRDRGVSFIGTPYDDRAEVLTKLSRKEQLPITVSGNPNQWKRVLDAGTFSDLYREGELYQAEYREAIWRSKINLSFLTHSNQDEFAHKSFEIAACGGFLLAERSQGHLERFIEDKEAVFFGGYDELVTKIRQYLPDEDARNRIAAAGHERAIRSGYDNDTQVLKIVEHIKTILPSIQAIKAGVR